MTEEEQESRWRMRGAVIYGFRQQNIKLKDIARFFKISSSRTGDVSLNARKRILTQAASRYVHKPLYLGEAKGLKAICESLNAS
jgi:hypothetical protein